MFNLYVQCFNDDRSSKGHTLAEAMQMSQEFTKMMLGEDYEITEEMGDIEALQGVSQFPARIKCATLAWKALEKGTVEKKVNQKELQKNKTGDVSN